MTTWSKEPPKEPGFYWRRKWFDPETVEHQVVEVIRMPAWPGTNEGWLRIPGSYAVLAPKTKYQWWPIPITPPSEERT